VATQQINLNADPSAAGVIQILPVSDPSFPGVQQVEINADPAAPGVLQANINFDPLTSGIRYVNFSSEGQDVAASGAILMESGSSILKEDMTGKIAKEQ
jgi:hypothetical protein